MKKDICKYFNGIQNECCEKAVNYQKLVGGEVHGWVKRSPCFKEHKTVVVCNSMKWPTDEEIKAHDDEFQARLEKMREAFAKIPDLKAKHPEGGDGEIECPMCKGNLMYSIARSNKHIRMKCETKGCISMIE